MSLARGFTFASGSVVLVSSAQLGMRWSMTRLPEPSQWLDALMTGNVSLVALAVVAASILAYALSMLCWLMALRDVPLGRAYSLLSVSYALVYLLAASLPFFNESFSLSKTLGWRWSSWVFLRSILHVYPVLGTPYENQRNW